MGTTILSLERLPIQPFTRFDIITFSYCSFYQPKSDTLFTTTFHPIHALVDVPTTLIFQWFITFYLILLSQKVKESMWVMAW